MNIGNDGNWSALIMRVASDGSGGGHIFSVKKGSSLCGVEYRFPHLDSETDHCESEWERWFKDNEPFICKACLKSYRKALSLTTTEKKQ